MTATGMPFSLTVLSRKKYFLKSNTLNPQKNPAPITPVVARIKIKLFDGALDAFETTSYILRSLKFFLAYL